jgi:MarR family transcriptional repressor of emrRAB
VADRLAQLLGVLSLGASDRVRSSVDASLGRAGAHAAALVHLNAYPGDSVQALADVLSVSEPGTVKVVNRLAGAGLLERRQGPDRRTRSLYLTAKGRAAAARVLADRGSQLGDVLRVLDRDERKRLEPLLEKLVGALADDRPGALTVCRLCDRASCCRAPARCPLEHTTP